MKRISVSGTLLAGSLSLLAATAPVSAQRATPAPRATPTLRAAPATGPIPPTSQSAPLQSAFPQYRGRPGGSYYPRHPQGPNGDRFHHGGNWRNNVYIPPVVTILPGGGYYPGGYYYNGLGNPYLYPYGVGAYGYVPNQVPGTVVQQEIIVVPDRARELQQSGALKEVPRPPSPARDERPGSKGQLDEFYRGGSTQNETISDALDDIRKAWLNGDVARLNARFKPDGKVRVYPQGEYKYTVEAREFTSMLKDAMTKIDTVGFEFDRPKAEEAGHVLVTGVHTFVDADKERRTTYVSYGLERTGGKWLITEAGSSAAPILKHQD